MQNKYFNVAEFQYAIKLLEIDPYEAKERFENYLKKYPTDYYARAYYVILLTRICMFEEAEKEFDAIIKESHNDSFYAYNANRLRGFKYNLCIAKLKILGAKEKYDEIWQISQNHKDLFDETDYNYLSYYCRSKLGLIDKEDAKMNKDAYRFNQSVDYSEEAFRDHIKKHEADQNIDLDIPNETIFSPDFPIDKIINEIKKYIPSDKRLFPGFFDDIYHFKFDNCGRVNNHLTNYFTVVCFHNTTNFITMYPGADCQKLPYVDLNYLKENKDELKENRPSQIDKFNRRFNRK